MKSSENSGSSSEGIRFGPDSPFTAWVTGRALSSRICLFNLAISVCVPSRARCNSRRRVSTCLISVVLIAVRVCAAWMFFFAHAAFKARNSSVNSRCRVFARASGRIYWPLIRSGDPEMRLKLKAEIRKRISRIEVSFGLDGFEAVADVKFINGVQRGIILDGERLLLLHIEGSL
jgi:hypothetical protein